MSKYISADKLIKDLRDNAAEHYNSVVNSIIIAQPSADVVEVKHGEWKHNKNNDVIKCSECGFGIMDSTFVWEIRNCCGTIEDNPFNFCPNCGADMRGEENG